jgi:hypothetical protein
MQRLHQPRVFRRNWFFYEAGWGKVKEQSEVLKLVWRVKTRHHDGWRGVGEKMVQSSKAIDVWQCKNRRIEGEITTKKTAQLKTLQQSEGNPKVVEIKKSRDRN